MLVEISMVEQRLQAVREVLDTGASVTDVAMRYAVDRRTVHRWLVRYANEGLSALADRSSRPGSCPHQMPAAIEALIVSLRRAHPGWGPRTLLAKLKAQLEAPPSRSSIYRCLVRHRLIEPKPRRRTKQDYRRWERSRPMELWQMDVMGGIRLTDGTALSVVTGIDDHSRFCVLAHLVVRATAGPVCDALLKALNAHGVPEAILTDNGKVFTGKLAPRPATVLFDRICHNNGIRHLLTAPYSPTTTGKIERLHKTMRKEFFSQHSFESIEQAQQALDAWVQVYNTQREHQGIGDVPPITRFELRAGGKLEIIDGELPADPPPAAPRNVVARRVDGAGRVSILKNRYHVGKHLAGRTVSVESKDGLLFVHHHDVLVATHARRHLIDDDHRMDRSAKATKPARPTKGGEVLRKVDSSGAVSFAATAYRVGNKFIGQVAGVRIVGDTVQITIDGSLVRTHAARHDKSKEFAALAQPDGKPRRPQSVA